MRTEYSDKVLGQPKQKHQKFTVLCRLNAGSRRHVLHTRSSRRKRKHRHDMPLGFSSHRRATTTQQRAAAAARVPGISSTRESALLCKVLWTPCAAAQSIKNSSILARERACGSREPTRVCPSTVCAVKRPTEKSRVSIL